MKKSRFSETQIVSILKEAGFGVCRIETLVALRSVSNGALGTAKLTS